MGRRAKAFDMAGGILSVFPWFRYVAPEASGYKLLVTLNNEVKLLLMVRLLLIFFSFFWILLKGKLNSVT